VNTAILEGERERESPLSIVRTPAEYLRKNLPHLRGRERRAVGYSQDVGRILEVKYPSP